VIEVAEILRQYGPSYREQFGSRMLPSHQRAMQDIEQCRTEALGGHVYYCPDCDQIRYSYHSCQNRHCPKCQHDAAQQWLARQQELLLPVPYFLLTFTLPEALRSLAHSHQQLIYTLLFRTSAAATQELAQDPRFVGGQIGLVGVLQTWTRDLLYHPHVHYVVPGGGLSADGTHWRRARNHFLVHVKPLSRLFRAKFRDALRLTPLFHEVPSGVWAQEWVVHCQPVGDGVAALKYLAPYIFRIAISNRRILRLAHGQVTFVYQDAHHDKRKTCTISAEEFLRRFLQHVLPKGFVKVRYYGLFSPGHRRRLQQARQCLGAPSPLPRNAADLPFGEVIHPPVVRCPTCGKGMQWVQTLPPKSRSPPKGASALP